LHFRLNKPNDVSGRIPARAPRRLPAGG